MPISYITHLRNKLIVNVRSISHQRRITLLNCLRLNKIEFMKSMHRHHQFGGMQQFFANEMTRKKFYGKLN